MSAGDNRRRHPRTPVSLLVQFRFDTFEELAAEYATNLSPGGMFIQTREPKPVGDLLYLQFSLKDGSKLIEGLARVVRAIPPGEGGGAPGMGIEFVDFDEESMALVKQICDGRAR